MFQESGRGSTFGGWKVVVLCKTSEFRLKSQWSRLKGWVGYRGVQKLGDITRRRISRTVTGLLSNGSPLPYSRGVSLVGPDVGSTGNWSSSHPRSTKRRDFGSLLLSGKDFLQTLLVYFPTYLTRIFPGVRVYLASYSEPGS